MIKVLPDQPDLGGPVFILIVNLDYKTDLSSYAGVFTASSGGCYMVQQDQSGTRAPALVHSLQHGRRTVSFVLCLS